MKNTEYFEKYNRNTHILGRIVSAVGLVLLVGAPFVIGGIVGALPNLTAVAKGFVSVVLV